MAGALIGGAVLGDAVSKLSDVIILVIKKTWYFKSQLNGMQETLTSMRPIFEDMEKLNEELDRRKEETDKFINLLKRAEDLVRNCEHIKWDLWKRYRYASKLEDFNGSLLKFVQIHLQLQMARDGKETLVEVKGWKKAFEKGSSSGWSSGVPLPKGAVIGFDDRVRALKRMLLKDPVVVVSAAGGCGKTTLVTKLCDDHEMKEKFGRNIYFATISRTYDLKVLIKNFLERNQVGKLPDFTSDEVAIQQWGSFLRENKSEILLVLDDVWSDSVIKNFMFESPVYKILVTSRTTFTQFSTYQLQVMNDQDATNLFRLSAFSEHGNEHSNIPDDLVEKLVKCCKNHPLLLTVIGGLLKGTPVASWKVMLKKLSEKNKSILDFHNSIQVCLEKSLYLLDEPEIKPFYLDFGLFPEDQKIAATALMDMWVHLYNHDEEGCDTLDKLTKLSFRNLATLLPVRKHLAAIANHCEDESVMQHDMMRTLAIHLSSQGSVEQRERLIISPDGQDLLQLPQIVNARVLSISTDVMTDERFFLKWNNIQVPKAEVFVLNIMSKIHPLPQFMQNMEKLKVLIITNYGYFFSEIQNFPASQYISGLTRIRLDHVSISSISTTVLELENLQKLSLIMCKIGNSFNQGISNKLRKLSEIDIDSCDDLVTFPAILCNLGGLKKLSITNCHELTSLSEEFGKLLNLEVLRLASCSKLIALPESMRNLEKLRIIDLSHCLSLHELPVDIGELGSLQTIDVRGCMGLHELPNSIKDFHTMKVVCDEETSQLWRDFTNVKIKVVKEDTLDTFFRIIPRGNI